MLVAKDWTQDINDNEVNAIKHAIDSNGFAVISDYIKRKDIEALNQYAESVVQRSNDDLVLTNNKDDLKGTLLYDIPHSGQFKSLCQRISQAGSNKALPKSEVYQVVRFLKGANGQKVSAKFHYDSYVLTAILPLAIPEGRGNLLLVRRPRKIRKWYLSNLLDKMVIENKISQKLLHRLVRSQSKSVTSLRLEPGNLYFFWGYRTIHTNEAADKEKLRATVVFHYGDPHRNSSIRSFVRKARKLKLVEKEV